MFTYIKCYRENRRLVRDIQAADYQVMTQLDEISKLKLDVKRAEEITEARKADLTKVRAELTKTKKLVREQTGADLLVNALRELGVVPPAGVKDRFTEDIRLRNQMAAAQQQGLWLGDARGQSLPAQSSGLNGIFGIG